MKKWQWFVSSLMIMTGSLIFLSLFTYSATLVYSTFFEEERFEPETQIANMDISELNQDEASIQVQQNVESWKAERSIVLRWFDKEETYPTSDLNFLVDETIEDMMFSEELQESLTVLGNEQQLISTLEAFEFYSDIEQVVFTEELLYDMEEEISTLPNQDVVINVHEYVFEDQVDKEQQIQETSRFIDSPLLEAVIHDLPTITIEADSRFSVLDTLEEARIDSVTEKPLSVLGSAIYELLLQSNFHLIERAQNDVMIDDIPLGYDAKIVSEQQDLVFDNPNPIDYELQFQFTNNQLTVGFIGEEFPYVITVELENEETITPRTIVQYSENLAKGSTQIDHPGMDGMNYELVRAIINPLDEENTSQQIANDYYAPVHRVEIRSKEDLIEEEEEPMQPDGFYGENGDGSYQGPPPSEDQPWGGPPEGNGEQPWGDSNGEGMPPGQEPAPGESWDDYEGSGSGSAPGDFWNNDDEGFGTSPDGSWGDSGGQQGTPPSDSWNRGGGQGTPPSGSWNDDDDSWQRGDTAPNNDEEGQWGGYTPGGESWNGQDDQGGESSPNNNWSGNGQSGNPGSSPGGQQGTYPDEWDEDSEEPFPKYDEDGHPIKGY
ncbi:VanW family protein [Salipaludibacillus keqinensis]|nr:VanW family protein [Salipaludibacillus keqinensis]